MSFVLIVTFILLIKKDIQVNASLGDSFPSYKSCVDTCRLEYCEKGKIPLVLVQGPICGCLH